MSDTQHFDGNDITTLPPAQRAAHYRTLADRHLRLGEAAGLAEARASNLELAALWTRLAAQAEHEATHPVCQTEDEVPVPSV